MKNKTTYSFIVLCLGFFLLTSCTSIEDRQARVRQLFDSLVYQRWQTLVGAVSGFVMFGQKTADNVQETVTDIEKRVQKVQDGVGKIQEGRKLLEEGIK